MSAPFAMAIPEAVLPNIIALLARHGIDCEPIPLTDSDDPARFLLLLRCSRGDGTVRLSIQRETHVNSDGPIVVFHSNNQGRQHAAQSIALTDTIADTLKENGGWIPAYDAS